MNINFPLQVNTDLPLYCTKQLMKDQNNNKRLE